jgi:hypothetical protein
MGGSFTPRYGVNTTATSQDEIRAKPTIQKILPAYSPAPEREPHRQKADDRHQRPGEHRRGRGMPGEGGGVNPVEAFFEFHHHHFDGDDGVVHQQAQGNDQRAQGDAVELAAGEQHDHKHYRQGQRHRRHHQPHAKAQGQQADQHDHRESDEEFEHEFIHRQADVFRLVGDFGEVHPQGQVRLDSGLLGLEAFVQFQAVPMLLHDDPEHQRRVALVADAVAGRSS